MVLRRSPSSFVALFGTVTLVAGTLAGIAAGCETDPDKCTILLGRNTPGGTLGFLTAPVSVRTPGATTFSITSTSATETSTVNWVAIPKNVGLAISTTYINNASLRRPPSGQFVQRGRSAAMVAGSVTVTATPFSANSVILAMMNTPGGTPGKLFVSTSTANPLTGQFVINSNSGTDTSTVDWVVIDAGLRFSPSGRTFSQSKGAMVTTTSFSNMNPLQEDMSVIASYIGTSNPGNLGAPSASRTGGSIVVTSTDAADAGLIELAAF